MFPPNLKELLNPQTTLPFHLTPLPLRFLVKSDRK
jgi:hypothetical protein